MFTSTRNSGSIHRISWELELDILMFMVYIYSYGYRDTKTRNHTKYSNLYHIYSNTLIDNIITRWLNYLCPSAWQTYNPALPELRFLMLEEVIHCVFDILRIVERRSSIVEIISSRHPLFISSVRKLPKASTFYHTWEIFRIFWNRKIFFFV